MLGWCSPVYGVLVGNFASWWWDDIPTQVCVVLAMLTLHCCFFLILFHKVRGFLDRFYCREWWNHFNLTFTRICRQALRSLPVICVVHQFKQKFFKNNFTTCSSIITLLVFHLKKRKPFRLSLVTYLISMTYLSVFGLSKNFLLYLVIQNADNFLFSIRLLQHKLSIWSVHKLP